MLKEFKAFVARGNLVDLAVAFILGVAFAAVVTAFADTILGAVSYAVGGSVSFDGLGVHRGGSMVIPYGRFLTAVVSFVILAAALFFVVKAYNRFLRSNQPSEDTKPCPFCRTSIPLEATRCPNCTSRLDEMPVPVSSARR